MAPTLQSAVTTGFVDANVTQVNSVATSTAVTSSTAGLVTIVVQLAAASANTCTGLTGAGSNWGSFSLVKRSQSGANDIEIWQCTSTGALNGTLTANFQNSTLGGFGIWVYCWDAGTLLGVSNTSSGGTANASVGLTGVNHGSSVCIAGFSNWTNTNVPTGFFVNYGGAFTAITNSYTNAGDSGGAGYSEQLGDDPTVSATIASSTNWVGVAAEVYESLTDTAGDSAYVSDRQASALVAIEPETAFQPSAYQEDAFQISAGSGAVDPNALHQTQTEGAYAQDQESAAYAAASTETEGIYAQDQEAAKYAVAVSETEGAYAQDQEDVKKGVAATQTEGAYAQDQEDVKKGVAADATDGAYAQDQEAAKYAVAVTETEGAYAQDQEDVKKAASATVTDGVYASDPQDLSLAVGGSITATATDAAYAQDQEAYKYALALTETEAAYASDALAVAVAVAQSLTEGVKANDASAVQVAKAASAAEGAYAVDSLAFAISAPLSFSETENAVVSEAQAVAVASAAMALTQTEGARVSDAVAHAILGPGVAIYSNIYIWNGSSWVWWNGSVWS